MKLNKLHPSELYQWWVITTLALQVHQTAATTAITACSSSTNGDSKEQGSTATPVVPTAAAGMGADKLLQLAEAMAFRLLSKHTGCCPPSWESAMMYLALLQAQVSHASREVTARCSVIWCLTAASPRTVFLRQA